MRGRQETTPDLRRWRAALRVASSPPLAEGGGAPASAPRVPGRSITVQKPTDGQAIRGGAVTVSVSIEGLEVVKPARGGRRFRGRRPGGDMSTSTWTPRRSRRHTRPPPPAPIARCRGPRTRGRALATADTPLPCSLSARTTCRSGRPSRTGSAWTCASPQRLSGEAVSGAPSQCHRWGAARLLDMGRPGVGRGGVRGRRLGPRAGGGLTLGPAVAPMGLTCAGSVVRRRPRISSVT